MRILFDQGTPAPLRPPLAGHTISTAYEMGWAKLENGDLLSAAEAAFEAFITTDQNLRYQQNLTGRRLAILILPPSLCALLRAAGHDALHTTGLPAQNRTPDRVINSHMGGC